MTGSFNPYTRKVALAAAGSAALAVVVLFSYDPSRYHFYPVCVLHQTTGLLCPGCGSLRACHQLLHGNLTAAFHLNALLVLCLPSIGLSLLTRTFWRKHPGAISLSRYLPWLWLVPLLVLVLAFGVWRNLPGSLLVMFPR